MAENEEYKNLPIDEKCVHKLWKARVNGYEEVAKLFRQIDDEKSPEYAKYLGLIKKFVIDSNAVGQEKGLEATLAYIENYAHAGKTASEVMSGIVSKCMSAPKTKTKELALQVTLLYIEIEKFDIVLDELLKGMDQKNPKIVSACVVASTTALREFGMKIVNVKPLVKKLPALFADRDKTVRDEARQLAVEMYRWMGPALRPQLNTLQPVQITELEAEFAKLDGQKAVPTRYIRSQQQKQAKQAAEADHGDEGDDAEENEEAPQIDSYDIADPVEILSKIPKDFYEKLEAKKWTERKEALEVIENLSKTPKLENGDYGDLVRALKKTIQKDSNVVVVALATRCLCNLALGLKRRFQTYSGACMSALLDKFKEKKQNVVTANRDAVDAIYLSTNLEAILEDVLEALGNRNPSVKSETSMFLARAFTKTLPTSINKKLLKTICGALVKNVNEPDPTVRDTSCEALGTLMKLLGEKAVSPFIVELEKEPFKMTKVKECCENAVIVVKIPVPKKEKPAAAAKAQPKKAEALKTATIVKSKKPSAVPKSASADSLDQHDVEEEQSRPESGCQDPVARVDISNLITEALLTELRDKNWKVRNEALTKINVILQDAKAIKSNIGDLPEALAQRLTDSNTKIAQSSLMLCETIAKAMGPPIKQHIRTLFPGFLQGLGDNKSWMRAASLNAINSFADQCGYKEFFEDEMIGDALKSGSPALRTELWTWLAEKLPKIPPKTIPKEELNVCIPHLYNNLEDRNAEVRKAAQEAILGFMMHTSYEAMLRQTEKLKPASKTGIVASLEKVRPNLPIKPLPKKTAEKEDKAVRGTKPVANAKNAVVRPKGNSTGKSQSSSSRKKEDDVDLSPLLVVNNLKHQRAIDESKLKVLKWNFTVPREEFVELLKEQMTTANVNKGLMANMFHQDFRYHLKALEMLTDDLQENSQALISNLDLILKWLTLRFFDTNPSVLLKGLEYLQQVFQILTENEYRMLENEASAFIPYLIIKVGDPKDTVRNGVKNLFKQIGNIYPVNRLFTCMLEGLKSKNARQRAECLDVLSTIIEDHGVGVCVPSLRVCLKEIAKHISDRDNSVRNAALNCVVHAYYNVGDKVYKLVGNISDKDMSLLEERIKRAGKAPFRSPKSEVPKMVPQSPQKERESPVNDDQYNADVEPEEEEEDALPPIVLPQICQQKPREVEGPFRLDPEFMKGLERENYSKVIPKTELMEFDLDFLNEEVKIPSLSDTKVNVTPAQYKRPVRQKTDTSQKLESEISDAIRSMGSDNMTVAINAMCQVFTMLTSTKSDRFVDYEDEFMTTLTQQLRRLNEVDLKRNPIAVRVYRELMTVIDNFFSNSNLGRRVSVPVLKDIMNELISILSSERLCECAESEMYIRVINFHCIKFIEKSEHTNIICALLILIQDSLRSNISMRHTELVMKCLWRVIKMIPNWQNDLKCDRIFLEIHNFFKEFPLAWWKGRPVDTPVKTIKTIVHWIVKFRGTSALLDLKSIPDSGNSELEAYVNKLVKGLHSDRAKASDTSAPRTERTEKTDDPVQQRITKLTCNKLTEIFQKIGNKEETKEGLILLYDFMQQHPETDIEPFMAKCTSFFQDYIKNGLKSIADTRNASGNSIAEKVVEKVQATITPVSTEPASFGVEYWRQRLNQLQREFAD